MKPIMKISDSMKKTCIYIFAAAAISLAGCVKEAPTVSETENTHTLTVEVADNSTKTYTDGEKIYWEESGEELNIIYFAEVEGEPTSRYQSRTHENYALTDNKATFTADFSALSGATSYTFGAFYPYKSLYVTSSVNLTVPQEQTPTATSYDPAGDILVTNEPVTVNGLPDKVQFKLSRMVAIVNMTIKGIGAGELIEKVVVSSSAKPAGAVDFKVHEAGTVDNAKWYNNYEDITLDMGGRVATGEDDIWFTTVPTNLSDTDLTVTVTTDKYNYSKTIDLTGRTLDFKRADIAKFSVANLQRAEKPKTYKLLTDASDLTPGDQMVICTRGYASSSAYLLGTTANGTKCNVSSVTSILDGPEIAEIPADARVFTVEAGAAAGTLSFKADDGYLYGNYDSENWANTLWVKDTKDTESSWTVSVDSENSKAFIYNSAFTERAVNCTSNSSTATFNFASPSSYSLYVYIYYINGTSGDPEQPETSPLATPVVTASASGNTVTVSWNAVDGAKDYTVTCGSSTKTVSGTETSFTDLDYETDYNVSVVANPANASLNSASASGTASAKTEADPSAGAEVKTVTVTFPVEGASLSLGSYFFENDKIGISASGTGWRTESSDGYNGLYMGSSKELKITSINKTAIITKVTINNVDGKSISLSYTAANDSPYSKTTGNYDTPWEGNIDNYITFKANSGSYLASITVEYK